MTDENLNYWADIYCDFNARYKLSAVHRLSFALFLQNPAHCQRWIPLYGDNRALFDRSGLCVPLRLFLTDPELILAVLLMQPVYDDRPEPRPLLKKQRLVKYRLDWVEQYEIEQRLARQDKIPARWSGNRTVQPMKHFEPTAKYKSRGGHVCHR